MKELPKYYSFEAEDLNGEIWSEIENFKDYFVSNFGRIKSLKKNNARIIKPQALHGNCYFTVLLYQNRKVKPQLIHRLVAKAFIPNPDDKPFVNHINGIKTDNRVDNLEWCTQKENVQHAFKTGLRKEGGKNPKSALTDEQAVWCREVYIPDDPEFGQMALAKKLGTSNYTIYLIIHGKHYKEAGGKIHETFSRKTPDNIRDEIRRLYVKGSREFGSVALAKKFNTTHATILSIIKGK